MCVENRISERGVSWSGHQIEEFSRKRKENYLVYYQKTGKALISGLSSQTQLAGKRLLMFIGEARLYKIPEEWMCFGDPGFELRMSLCTDEPGVLSDFNHFYQLIVRRSS